jgi:uncharacterized oligopeptide transporter (OPT) family protein
MKKCLLESFVEWLIYDDGCVYRFKFDFSPTFLGVGMICPHVINLALLFGGIVSWGLVYPFLETKHGEWYHTESPSSLQGMNGYKVCTTS